MMMPIAVAVVAVVMTTVATSAVVMTAVAATAVVLLMMMGIRLTPESI